MKLQRLAPTVRRLDTRVARPAPEAADYADRSRGSRHARGYGTAWDKLRARILERDGYLCQCAECNAAGRLSPATHVDHIVERVDGGTDDPSNLQAMNADCHARKTAAEQARRRRAQLGG